MVFVVLVFYKKEREKNELIGCGKSFSVMHACNAAGGKLLTTASGVNRSLRIHAGFSLRWIRGRYKVGQCEDNFTESYFGVLFINKQILFMF